MGALFSFKVMNVRNPPNFKPIAVQSVNVLDLDKKLIQKYSIKPFPVIIMTSPAVINTKSI
jgi:hypothetical protein